MKNVLIRHFWWPDKEALSCCIVTNNIHTVFLLKCLLLTYRLISPSFILFQIIMGHFYAEINYYSIVFISNVWHYIGKHVYRRNHI